MRKRNNMSDFNNRRTVLEALKITLERNLLDTSNNFFSQKYRKTKILYHYSNLSSLKAIVENQTMFCSNSAYLNDKREYYYGLDLFKDALEGKLLVSSDSTEINILNSVLNRLNEKSVSNHFATCFSLEGDLLSQWRAYADDGKGISIGFDRKKLIDGFENVANGFYLEYNSKNQLKLVDSLITQIFDFYVKKFELLSNLESEGDLYDELSQEINELIDKYIGLFKHSSFEEEKEFRFETSIDRQFNHSFESVSYRIGKNNLLVPYKTLATNYALEKERLKDKRENLEAFEKNNNFKIKKLPISQIIIGPSLDFELNKHSIKDFLIKNDYFDVEIKPSEVPYRI